MLTTLQKPFKKSAILYSFLFGMAGALAIFLPFLVVDKGFFLYCGDYNSQQIPFYVYVQQFIKNGGGTWSWATDLGTSVVNSYSFYNIGSPFLWITMLFPSRWLPFMMVPLFMLKFGAIAASACLYLSRYAKTRNMLVVASLAFAFCGFNVYNIFFNHMLDPVPLFCLMLWAMDGFVYENKRGFFALFVGLALINNYFFFIGNVVFLLLYFTVKWAMGEYKITLKHFAQLGFEALLGVGIGMVLALPSFFNLIGNPRTDNFSNGFGLVLYGSVQQYFEIITSLFLPPDPPYLPNLFTEGAIKWTSMSAFLPILSVAGLAAYWKSRKHSAAKVILGLSLLMALVPILNSSYYAFNSSYYARWYYMPLLLLAFVTLRSLEDTDIDLVFGAKFAVAATAVYAVFGLLPTKKDDVWTLGVAQYASKFWLTFTTAMFAVVIFYLLVKHYRGTPRFAPLLLSAVMGFSAFYSVTQIALGKFPQWNGDANFRAEMYDSTGILDLPDDEFYRIDAYREYDNLGLWLDRSCLQTFNSVVTPSIMEFYPMVGVKRDVSSKPETSYFALRGLLSVKYTVMPIDEQNAFTAENPGSLGWRYYKEAGSLAVYENENFLPLGFTYDDYISLEVLKAMPTEARAPLLVRAIGLEPQQIADYGRYFGGELGFNYAATNYDNYVLDCAERRATASYDVQADSSGFTSRILMDRETLVFFAVPYDPGFTATVNGEAAEVLEVSGGMMAVLAPAGDNTITFTYRTPGFSTGIAISVGCLAVLAVYWAGGAWLEKRKGQKQKGTAK